MVDQLSSQIENREQQLETLDALLAKRKIQEDVFVAGRPVLKGWMASRFGRRTDPFTGNVAFHAGIDFATDRKSTRLNSSHVKISYAVFCLKKKKNNH